MKSEDNLETLLEQIETMTLTRSGVHKTLYRCDICSVMADDCGCGGCSMADLDGSTTFACSSCMKEYCEISADERKQRYAMELTPKQRIEMIITKTPEQYRKVAYYAGVGTDTVSIALMTRFPITVPFSHSSAFMRCIDRLCGNDLIAISLLDTQNNTVTIKYVSREDVKSASINLVSIHRCWNCSGITHAELRCRVCDFANYCSKACRKNHKKLHKACCGYVVRKMAELLGKKPAADISIPSKVNRTKNIKKREKPKRR